MIQLHIAFYGREIRTKKNVLRDSWRPSSTFARMPDSISKSGLWFGISEQAKSGGNARWNRALWRRKDLEMMHMDILKRRGRPRLSTCKDGYVKIRVSDKDRGIIDYLTQKPGKRRPNWSLMTSECSIIWSYLRIINVATKINFWRFWFFVGTEIKRVKMPKN